MSSYKTYLVLIFLLLFTGCSQIQETINPPSQKIFDKEDDYIIKALEYENLEAFNEASNMYGMLYEGSKKIEYRISQIKMSIKAKNYDNAKTLIKSTTQIEQEKDKILLLKLLVNIYLIEKKYEETNEISLQVLELEKNKDNYKLVANSYLLMNDFDKALIYLEKAYNYDNDEDILDDIVTILYLYKNDKNKAISYLESHLRLNQANKTLAMKLLKIYSNEKDIDGIISVYKLLYDNYQEDAYAKNLIDLYKFKGDIKNLISFLEKSQYDNKMLLSIYQNQSEYKKAILLAQKLYKETNDYSFMAQEAILEYEMLKVKNIEKVKDIIKKLDLAVNNLKEPNAVMYNYLGYLYIDHDVDVQNGITWVQKALELQKTSPFYMDSLAWGYYKIGEIDKSYEQMKQVVEMLGLEDKEISMHWQNISKRYEENILNKGK